MKNDNSGLTLFAISCLLESSIKTSHASNLYIIVQTDDIGPRAKAIGFSVHRARSVSESILLTYHQKLVQKYTVSKSIL